MICFVMQSTVPWKHLCRIGCNCRTGDRPVSETTDVDPDELRGELEQIKGALGLYDRRRDWVTGWLVFGLAVGLAGAVSQAIELRGLSSWLHPVTWFGLIGLAWAASYWLAPDGTFEQGEPGTPSVGFVYVAVIAAGVALSVLLGPVLETAEVAEQAVVFGLIVILVGTAYLLVGQLLRAHFIRRRDRLAFYVGGAWMLPFGAAVTHVELLATYAYGLYGALFLVHALASYWLLTRT